MKATGIILFIACMLLIASTALAQSTPILVGGEDTELSQDGIITGSGSSERGGLGAALLDTFTINYQPLGEGDWMDNIFPDEERYSLQMNVPDGLPDYQCQGVTGSWDSRGRNNEGRLPWVQENHQCYDQQYRPTGDEPLFGLVSDDVQWTIDYWGVDGENRFIHTCLTGTVEDFAYDDETGNATALLVLYESAYLGYGADNEPGPGLVEYETGVYQGFDLHKEASGPLDYPAYFFQYDGETNEGSLTPCGTKVKLIGEEGWIKGYFDVIQDAIDAAEDGDVVLVSPGTYVENINFEGKGITVASMILTTDDRAYIASTIIDGNEEDCVVSFNNEEDSTSVLRGFTIRNGIQDFGGGIDCQRNTSPLLLDLLITENTANNFGGGVYFTSGATPKIHRTTITNNNARLGGGMSTGGMGMAYLENVIIERNTASYAGGGMHAEGSGGYILNHVVIVSNESVRGGGVAFWGAQENVFNNVTISGNQAETTGGVLMTTYDEGTGGSTLNMVNSIVWGNAGTQISHYKNSEHEYLLDISYCDIEGGEDGVQLGGGAELIWGEGNIDEDPLFVDPDEGDYHLTEDSPCIDAGDPDSPEDPDETRADMGAYYFHQIGQYIDVPDDYETIQEAINASQDGDTVLVHPGTYVENVHVWDAGITIGSLYLTTGEEHFIEETIVDGDGIYAVFDLGWCERVRRDQEAVLLSGLTIQNARVGVYCRGAWLRIENCIIRDNHGGEEGGGIFLTHGTELTVTNTQFIDNRAINGGGIYCDDPAPVITGCTFSGNFAEEAGGAIYLINGAEPLIEDCIITGNYAGIGGAIYCDFSAPVIRNCLLEDNETEGDKGGAIAAIENAAPVIVNCTFDWEARYGWYTAIYLAASSARVVNSCIFGPSPLWIEFDTDSGESSIMIAYSDIMDGQESIETNNNGELHWEEGNIDEDPLFVDIEEGDYNLSEDSPCVDAGIAFFVWEDDTLINMTEDEYQGFAPDMGAFESPYENSVDGSEYTPHIFALYPSFPNPFNSITSIDYSLDREAFITLKLYDLAGREVVSLVNESQPAGHYSTTWNAEGMPSGLYFVRLEASGKMAIQKIMLIR